MTIEALQTAETGGRARHYVLGGISMLIGSVAVLSSVVLMNELSEPPEKKQVETVTSIEIEKAPKKKPKQQVRKPRPKPRRSPKAPPPPSMAALTSGLSGIEFDLPALQFTDIGDSAGDLLSTNDDDVVYTSDTVDNPPQPIEQPPMKFPQKLRDKGIEGYVMLSVLVDANGNIDRVKVIESKPPGTFDQVALEGIREWRFQPATYQGEPVKTWIRQKIRFELTGR